MNSTRRNVCCVGTYKERNSQITTFELLQGGIQLRPGQGLPWPAGVCRLTCRCP